MALFLFTRRICVYCSYSKLLEQKEELEQKHLHVIQILESERQAKWHYVQQTEELVTQAKNLKAEVGAIWVVPSSDSPEVRGLLVTPNFFPKSYL